MFQGNEAQPYYVFFHPFTSPSPQIALQSLFAPSNGIFWALPLAPTAPSLSSLTPENTEGILPGSQAREGGSGAGVWQQGRKGWRRPKNKRLRNEEKELESAKKNSESNIVNQLFSFFNSYDKSEGVVERAIRKLGMGEQQLEKVKSIFYNIVRLINYKRGRKYVNKENILSYYTPTQFAKQIPDIDEKLGETHLITLEQLCRLFRTTTAHFLATSSINAILTSKRITLIAKNQHLRRRRKVVHALTHKPQ